MLIYLRLKCYCSGKRYPNTRWYQAQFHSSDSRWRDQIQDVQSKRSPARHQREPPAAFSFAGDSKMNGDCAGVDGINSLWALNKRQRRVFTVRRMARRPPARRSKHSTWNIQQLYRPLQIASSYIAVARTCLLCGKSCTIRMNLIGYWFKTPTYYGGFICCPVAFFFREMYFL